MSKLTIANQEVQIREYKNQRVITFKEIDRLHSRPDVTAKCNFNANKNAL
jgi:hypothetical protein